MIFVTNSTAGIVVDIIFIFVFSGYLYWIWGLLRALKSDAPYVPMTDAVVQKMIDLADAPQGASWIDLGSGDGRVLIAAAKKFAIHGVGIERIGALRIWSRLRVWRAHVRNVRIRSGDFFNEDLSNYAVVSFYLLPPAAERLFMKLQKELRPGTLVLFHRFPLKGLMLEREDAEKKIYIARAPLKRL